MPTSGPLGWLTRRRYGFHDVALSSWVENAYQALAIDERRKPFAPALWEVSDADIKSPTFKQHIEQTWFAGVHSNVGGGYPDGQLSDLALAWMYGKVESCGLALEPAAKAALRGHCCGTLYDSMTLFYRTFGALTRIIDMPRKSADGSRVHTFERVDASAFERRRKFEPKYDPVNLRGFADGGGASP